VNGTQSGTSKAGKEWTKLSFLLETTEEYNNLYCFDVFGDEKVENFNKYNKVGQEVDVEFNVKTNEWNDKYFTSLDAWKIFKAEVDGIKVDDPDPEVLVGGEENDLPF
jgi:hypothetical protein